MKITVSRNKREGKYAGKYAAPHIVKHWRTGLNNKFDSLKDSAEFYALINNLSMEALISRAFDRPC